MDLGDGVLDGHGDVLLGDVGRRAGAPVAAVQVHDMRPGIEAPYRHHVDVGGRGDFHAHQTVRIHLLDPVPAIRFFFFFFYVCLAHHYVLLRTAPSPCASETPCSRYGSGVRRSRRRSARPPRSTGGYDHPRGLSDPEEQRLRQPVLRRGGGRAALGQRAAHCYIGFDPTADSLHVGHLFTWSRWPLCSARPPPRSP